MVSNLIRRIVMLGTPLVLAVLMLFHPSPYRDVEGELIPVAGWWLTLHAVQFVLFALMGAAVWMLVGGMRGTAATVSRVAVAVFVVFYDVGDAIAGVSTGILARSAAALPAGERAAVAGAIDTLFRDPTKNLAFALGIIAWILALLAAVVALHRAGAPRSPLVLLALSACLITFDHAFPFGSLTFATFLAAALWMELDRWGRAAGPTSAQTPVVGTEPG